MEEDEVVRELIDFEDRLDRLRQRLSDVVRTEQVEILDEHGITRIICSGRGGFVTFGLNGSDRFLRADLSVRDDGMPFLVFLGEPRARIELAIQTEVGEGVPFLSLTHTRAKTGIWLGQDIDNLDAGIFLERKTRIICAELAVDMPGRPSLTLRRAGRTKQVIKL